MSNTYFEFKHFTVHQERCAMKVGTDGCLLGAWAANSSEESFKHHILDVGTGTGLIALMMAQRYPLVPVTAIEIDPAAAEQARENVAQSPFASRIQVVQGDFLDMNNEDKENSFSAIVCNPPYFVNSLGCPDPQRMLARHSNLLTYGTFMRQAKNLLAPEGEVSVILPFDYKHLMEDAATMACLFPTRTCVVRTSEKKAPRRCLMAFSNSNKQQVEYTELVIGSPEHAALMHDFYLKM